MHFPSLNPKLFFKFFVPDGTLISTVNFITAHGGILEEIAKIKKPKLPLII